MKYYSVLRLSASLKNNGFDVEYKGFNYEIAYTISEVNGKKVVVLLAGTRENFYEQLKRYIK